MNFPARGVRHQLYTMTARAAIALELERSVDRYTTSQTWDARGYAENARFVADLGAPVLDLLAPQRGERILDVGCGDGALTAKIGASGAEVVGIDSSAELVAAARAAGVDARLMDARDIRFSEPFDAVFTNAALHWITQPELVLAGVRRAVRPGGRFVGEFGGQGNVAAVRTALAAVLESHGLCVASPWYFPTPDEYAQVLAAAGFVVDAIALIPRPTLLPTGLRGWLETFANPFVGSVDAARRNEIFTAVEARLAPILRDAAGRWTADYVRLRFAARAA
jgi:SAM-dependent methyltransferase